MVRFKRKKLRYSIGVPIMLLLEVVFSFIRPTEYSDTIVRFGGIVTVATYVLALWTWYDQTKKIGSLYFIFMIMCFSFNAGQILLDAFNISFVGIVNIYKSYSNELLIEMMLFQSRAVLALGIGGCIAYNDKAYELRKKNDPYDLRAVWHNRRFGILEVAYLVVYAMTILVYLREFFSRSGVSYGEYYYGNREGINIYLLFAYHVLLYVVFMLHDKDTFSKWLLVCNVLLVVIMLMIGSRNATLQMVFGCFFIYLYVKRNMTKIPIKKLLILILAGMLLLIIFTGFQDVRQMSFSELSVSKILDIYSGSLADGLIDALVQMGGSARCLLQTMQEVNSGSVQPEQTFFYAFARGTVPVSLLSLLRIDAPSKFSLAAWITEVGGSHSGWGYSIFAEMYYNFKGFGWIFGFFFAFAYVKLEQKALNLIKQRRLIFAASIIYVLSYAIFISRSDMILISSRMRMCVYVGIVSYIMHKQKIRIKL